MPATPTRLLELSPPDRLRLELWLAEFEEAWDEDRLAAWVARLPPPGQPLRLPALIELVKIDLERNWQRGRQFTLAHYLSRYPELGPAGALPSDLRLAEEEAHRQFGGGPATLVAPAGGDAGPPAASRVPRVRGYEVLGKLGQGGMGAVYKARHLGLNRAVALKVVCDAPSARPEDLVRFRREAELTARLQHANIVQVYEVGEYAGGSYLALEYVDGPALDRHVNGTPQPPRKAARLVEALARAVHYAHGQGVIHRDLKPANVLLQAPGSQPLGLMVPKITDFGLARHAELESGLTTAGAVMGTPSYMAPEQADGRLRDIGPHTDVYALGAILYECLTGRPPFQGTTVLDTLAQVRQQEPVPPHRLLGSNGRACPADLETICLKCLEKDPARRYATALDLADDLGRYQAGRPIAARPVGPAGRAWRWARRNPGWAAMLAAVAGLLLAIAVGSPLLALRADEARRRAEEEKRKADENLWVALLEQARARSVGQRPGQRFEGLAAIRQALRLPVPPGHSLVELRDVAIACLALPDVEPAGDWREGWPPGTDSIALDATFEHCARADRAGNVSVRRVADDAELFSRNGWGRPEGVRLAFSPDGRFLLHGCPPDRRLKLYPLHDPTAEVVLVGAPADFSPDGRLLAVGDGGKDGSIAVYDIHSAGQVKKVQSLPTGLRPERIAFAPDSHRLAVACGNVLRVFSLEGGQAPSQALSHRSGTRVDHIAWHPNGRTLATACDDHHICLWDVVAGKALPPELVGHHGGMTVAFDPSGDCLLSNDWSRTLRLWDHRTGRQLLQAPGTAAAFNRDGSLLGLDRSGSRVRFLHVAARRPLRCLAPFGDCFRRHLCNARSSPDGRFLLVNRGDALAFVDWAGGSVVGSIPLPFTTALHFEADGALLTSGPAGLLRWPMRAELGAGRLHVGPQQPLNQRSNPHPHGCSADGQVIAIPGWCRSCPLVFRRPGDCRVLQGDDVRDCAVSPDGCWVATGNHSGGATVWDTRSFRPVKNFPVGDLCAVGFSPKDRDRRWLLTTGGGFRLWEVGTWEEGPVIARPDDRPGAGFAFAPDGRVVALSGSFGQIRLVDPHTGAEIARLTVPEQTELAPQCFSPDGAQLVAIGNESHLLYIWDLRALRAELKGLDLDWAGDDYPPPSPAPEPLRLEVIMGGGRK